MKAQNAQNVAYTAPRRTFNNLMPASAMSIPKQAPYTIVQMAEPPSHTYAY